MVEKNPVQSKSEEVHEKQEGRAKVRKALRMKGRNKGKEKEKKGPKLGAGGAKGAKEMAENELENKLAENEEKRRLWLMTWHLEVDQMNRDLWDMEQTLATSLVRTDSAKARDRENRFQVAKPQMTEEELEKLPVRMRPKPKYKPYLSQREMSDINTRSYHKIIRNLHDNPRKFEMTPDGEPTLSGKSRFPHIGMSGAEFDKYRLLLLKNPFNKNRERDNFLLRSRTDFLQVPIRPGKPYYKIQTSRSADVSSNLPQLKIPSGPDLGPSNMKAKDPDTTLPALNREKSLHLQDPTKVLSPVKETNKEDHGVGHSSAHSYSDGESEGSLESDESGYMMAIKAKKQAAKKKQQGKGGDGAAAIGMPEKHQPNLLDDANLRKNLIQQLDEKRQERARGNKWGMIKNAFKVTGMLKVKMPDVIKDQAKNKHKNRAIDQVQERIKARQDEGGNTNGGGGLNRRLSQSMGALDQTGQARSNKVRY